MLKREIGLWSATAIIVGQMIGTGIYMLPQGFAQLANPPLRKQRVNSTYSSIPPSHYLAHSL